MPAIPKHNSIAPVPIDINRLLNTITGNQGLMINQIIRRQKTEKRDIAIFHPHFQALEYGFQNLWYLI